MNLQTDELNFDQLVELAAKDPIAFEAYRTEQIEATISSAAPKNQRRLRGIQFQVDAQRSLQNNAVGSCVKVYEMMQESLGSLNGLLQNYTNGTTNTAPVETMPAKVLSFYR